MRKATKLNPNFESRRDHSFVIQLADERTERQARARLQRIFGAEADQMRLERGCIVPLNQMSIDWPNVPWVRRRTGFTAYWKEQG